MAAITLLGTQTFNTTSGTKNVTATPADGDLIAIITAHTGNTSSAAPTDSQNGTYALINSAVKASSADTMRLWVRNTRVSNASTTFTHAPGTSSGGGLAVFKITGMSRFGAQAVRQSAIESNQAGGGTPTPVLGSAALTGNCLLGAVFNATNPATLTARSSPAWTERFDAGYATPTTGLEAMSIDSGETGTSLAWGGTSASAFASLAAEFDTSSLNQEDGDTWNEGIAQRSVGGVIARAAAILATTVAIAAGLHSPPDEFPSAAQPGNFSAVAPASQRAHLQPLQVRWGANDEVVTPAPVALDDGTSWEPARARSAAATWQPWFAEDLLPIALDDAHWAQQGVWQTRATLRLWQAEDDAPFAAPAVGLDESEWAAADIQQSRPFLTLWHGEDEAPFTAPAPALEDVDWAAPWVVRPSVWSYAWGTDDEIVTAAPEVAPGLTSAATQRAQQSSVIWRWTADDEFVTPPAPLIDEDYHWVAQFRPTPAAFLTPYAGDEVASAPAGIVDEDAWPVAVVAGAGARPFAVWSAQDSVPVLPVDEQYDWRGWWAQRAPAYQPWADDGSAVVAQPAPTIDEQYHWIGQFRPTPAAFLQPHAPDEVVTPPAPLIDEAYHWIAQYRPTPAAFLQPHAPDEVVTPPAPGIVDDEPWSLVDAAVRARAFGLEPWIDADSLGVQPVIAAEDEPRCPTWLAPSALAARLAGVIHDDGGYWAETIDVGALYAVPFEDRILDLEREHRMRSIAAEPRIADSDAAGSEV